MTGRELGGCRRWVGSKRGINGAPLLGHGAFASPTTQGAPEGEGGVGDFAVMGAASPPCLSHLTPPPDGWGLLADLMGNEGEL